MKTTLYLGIAALSSLLAACAPGSPDGTDDNPDEGESSSDAVSTKSGINGGACYLSDYDCKLRVSGGNRIEHTDGTVDWEVEPNAPVLDGNGDVVAIEKSSSLKFNYGQRRSFGGQDYVFAMTTSNGSAGWFPLAKVKSSDVLDKRVGSVSAHRSGLAKMACYEIRNSVDMTLAARKVVKDSTSAPGPAGEAAGDYLPKLRANGKHSANLVYNIPGYALGGPAIDHFPAGTKFQRLDVQTEVGAPSLDIPLWAEDGNGHFLKPAGSLKFIYGYIVSKPGEVRVGWIAYPAVTPSTGCP